MARYLGRHLMVKGKYVDAIVGGFKKTTIRLGVVKPRYREVIIHGGGKPVAKAAIVSVRYKKLRELTEEDALKDGFKTLEELMRELEDAYGRLNPDDTVTIIEFKITERFSELDASKPYMGLEPVDIARLALRYLAHRLPQGDKEILLELTRSNSIRAVALKKYGDIGKRYLIRRTLRRALTALIREGVLKVEDNGKHI